MIADETLTVAIPAPRDRHDALVRDGVTPLVRALTASPSADAVYFERFNKPDWGVRVRVLGAARWLESDARELAGHHVESAGYRAAFVNDDVEDKWIGGPAEARLLKRLHHVDTAACLDLLELESRGELGTSRAQWSLLVVEGLLDLFDLRGDARLDFYRRGFQWAPDLGRWDAEVFSSLDRKFETQADALRAAVGMREPLGTPAAWGGAGPARIAARLLASSREPACAVLAASEARRLDRSAADLAGFVVHAHANRLGIHATQEGTMRYLVWRARGGVGPLTS